MIKTISPIDNTIYCEYPFSTPKEQQQALMLAKKAQHKWADIKLTDRIKICNNMLNYFKKNKDIISEEISWQMGRPIQQAAGEIAGLIERSEYMIKIAGDNLKNIEIESNGNIKRFIQRNPIGIVMVISPWNYPYLTAINAILPAILSGNAVILKHSSQTPKCAQRFHYAFDSADLPSGVFQYLYLSHTDTESLIQHPNINFVTFTGSIKGGLKIQNALKDKFIHCGLELGGKDPAYVCDDCDIEKTLDQLVDGAFFNSGQSCCAVERIYVENKIYDTFVEGYVNRVNQYRLGNPLHLDTNIGPIAQTINVRHLNNQVTQAKKLGAVSCIDPMNFKNTRLGANYLAPQVMTHVNHDMHIMTEESFGPVIGIMSVNGEQEAIDLMNDSQYGLSASIWTADTERALHIGNQVQTGTWFMNQCDYLDPALVWTGVKNTGKGYSLSSLGFQQLTQAKSYNLKKSFNGKA